MQRGSPGRRPERAPGRRAGQRGNPRAWRPVCAVFSGHWDPEIG